MKIIFLLILSIGIFISCTKENKLNPDVNASFTELEKSAPSPDHSTPENLINSLWKYKIWSDTVFVYDTSLTINKFYSKIYYSNQQNMIRNSIDEIKKRGHFAEQNKILRIEKKSDSLVSVYTKELKYQGDERADELRYDLVKTNNGWLINDCLKKCSICNGSGKDTFEKNKNCNYCNGTGWISTSAY